MAEEYIKRDAVVKELQEELDFESTMYTADQNKHIDIGLKIALRVIRKAPTADVVEVKHGRWEYLQDDEWRCSNCHNVFNTGGKWIPMTDNFCSNCGADMRERRGNNATD